MVHFYYFIAAIGEMCSIKVENLPWVSSIWLSLSIRFNRVQLLSPPEIICKQIRSGLADI